MKNKISIIALLLCLILCIAGCTTAGNSPQPAASLPPSVERVPNHAAEPPPSWEPGLLTVWYLDVGQGDSIFVRLPNGQTMLIDAGNAGDDDIIVPFVQQKGGRKIDYLIATHPHADHIGSMAKVVQALDVGQVYMPRKEHTTKTFQRLLEAMKQKGLTVKTAKAGVVLLEEGGIKAEFLAPVKNSYHDLNNYSAVLRLTYRNTSFLFMGDAEQEVEQELLSAGTAQPCDVLKVGHHGSSTSSSLAFLEAVKPKYGVISCGQNNKYGHPAQQTLSNLEEHGVTVLRTDQQGTICATSDGTTVSIQ